MSDTYKIPSRGRPFVKGQVANPKGRPSGLPDRRTKYRELIEARMPELVQKCVDLALQGDMQAMRLCLERVLPPVRPGDDLISVSAPDGCGIGEQAQSLVVAVLDGKVSPSAAQSLMNVLIGQARVMEVEAFETRLTALEKLLDQETSNTVAP